ncbi:MAG: hypothetical protein II916_06950, partial [Oscillospiraceae bacterium]|nr:hypothetical protein [Oscillospiraceae bacterium]
MKHWLGILLAGFFLLTVQTLPVRAEELYDDTLSALLELGGDANFLPESADLSAPETLTEPGIGGFFAKTCELIRQEARAPLQTFTLLLGVILLSALAGGLRIGEGTGVVYETL